MSFKMSAEDFKLLNKFIEKKAKGSSLKFDFNSGFDHKFLIQVETEAGETAIITFFSEEMSKFPEITKTKRLGDEL